MIESYPTIWREEHRRVRVVGPLVLVVAAGRRDRAGQHDAVGREDVAPGVVAGHLDDPRVARRGRQGVGLHDLDVVELHEQGDEAQHAGRSRASGCVVPSGRPRRRGRGRRAGAPGQPGVGRVLRADRLPSAWPPGRHVGLCRLERVLLDPGHELRDRVGRDVRRGHPVRSTIDRLVEDAAADAAVVDHQLVVVDLHVVGVGVVPAHGVERRVQDGRQDHHEQQRPERDQPSPTRRPAGLAAGPPPVAELGLERLGSGQDLDVLGLRPVGPAADPARTPAPRAGRSGSRRPRRRRPGTSASSSSPTTTSTTTTVMLSLPPWVRAARTSRSAATCGSGTVARTSAIWGSSSSLVSPSLHSRNRSPRAGWIRHRSTDTSSATPEGAGQDVPVGVHGGLGLAELAAADHLLGQAVVDGDLGELAVVVAVGARVAHVDEGDDVPVVLVHQGRRSHGGAHAPQLGVVEAVLEHHPVGLGDGLGQSRPGGLGAEGDGSACRRRVGPPPRHRHGPPMPSATANRVPVSTARSWLTDRTSPVSVAEPERSSVMSAPDLEHGAADLEEVPLLQLGPLLDADGVDPGAVGRAEVLHPQVAVEAEQAGVQVRGVGVVVDGDPAAGCPAHGHLLADVVDPAGLVVGTDDVEAEAAPALAVHHRVDVPAPPPFALERTDLDPDGPDDPHEEQPEQQDDPELQRTEDRGVVDGYRGGCCGEDGDQGRAPGLTKSRSGARWCR